MIIAGLSLALCLGVAQVAPPPTPHDTLARARQAYNEGRYDDAITAAAEAVQAPDLVDSASVVLARAHLERYHKSDAEHRDLADLDVARDALKRVESGRLSSRDQLEFLVAMGESLFFDQPPRYAAAAEMFDTALRRSNDASPEARETLVEWWAESLDREAQFVPEEDREGLYRRILARAEAELTRDDESAVAIYWIAAASRGTGDLDRALGAATAGWIRAGSLGERGAALRVDLDRLVTNVILPARAMQLAPGGDARSALSVLEQQWDELKKKWERTVGSTRP